MQLYLPAVLAVAMIVDAQGIGEVWHLVNLYTNFEKQIDH